MIFHLNNAQARDFDAVASFEVIYNKVDEAIADRLGLPFFQVMLICMAAARCLSVTVLAAGGVALALTGVLAAVPPPLPK